MYKYVKTRVQPGRLGPPPPGRPAVLGGARPGAAGGDAAARGLPVMIPENCHEKGSAGKRRHRLRSFVADRGNRDRDDWPGFRPLAEFVINDPASQLGSCCTLLYAGSRGQHPSRPLTPPDVPDQTRRYPA